MDLYELYRRFYHRSHRSPKEEIKRKLKDLAREIAHKKFLADEDIGNFIRGEIPEEIHREILMIAIEIEELEQELAPNVRFSRGLVKTINERTYTADVPANRRNLWLDSEEYEGYLYAMMLYSNSKEKLLKIGATTMDPYERLQKFSNKYGCDLILFGYGVVTSPFKSEQELAGLLRSCRVSANTFGYSNELYYLNEAKPIFIDFIIKRAKPEDVLLYFK